MHASSMTALAGLLVVGATGWALYNILKPSHSVRDSYEPPPHRDAFHGPKDFITQPVWAEMPRGEVPAPVSNSTPPGPTGHLLVGVSAAEQADILSEHPLDYDLSYLVKR